MRQAVIVGVYRYGHWVWTRVRVPLIRQVLYAVALVLQFLVMVTLHAEVRMQAEIGRNLRLGHGGHGVVVHAGARIGDDVVLTHGVTIGDDLKTGAPTLGDAVYVGTGAVIIGAVTVGDGAKIGANAVVLQDVPAGATAVGVPARIVAGP
ncbi:MAG: serine acetyltransferase [Actinobacteria bacterium]|nr:MAG: serine acetyltransferase [Actinomycetota bacterium]